MNSDLQGSPKFTRAVYLPYLDDLYLGKDALWVPKVSDFESVGTEFDGSPVNMRFDDLQLT